jgi:hypothetical protein
MLSLKVALDGNARIATTTFLSLLRTRTIAHKSGHIRPAEHTHQESNNT